MAESPAQAVPPLPTDNGQPGNPGSMGRTAWCVLVVYTSTLFMIFLGSSRTLNSRESYVAVGASEMVSTGDWLVPRLAGEPWLEKPPFPQWMVAAFSGTIGDMDEWIARFPAALAGLIGVLIIAQMATRWFGPTHGLLAGLVQATTVYTLNYARLATSDIYLWTLVMGILAIFARAFVGQHPLANANAARMGFYALLGLTQLVKGPLFGAVMALLPCLGFIVWQRQWSAWRWFLYWPGILVCGIIAVAWPVAIVIRYPEAANLWWLHTFGRLDQHGVLGAKPAWYYLSTLPWQIAPWTFLAFWTAGSSATRAWRGQAPVDRFLWVWSALPFVALSAVAGKHPHYIIYALPPFSIWAAEGLIRGGDLARRFCASPWRVRGTSAISVAALAGFGWWSWSSQFKFGSELLVISGMFLISALAVGWGCRLANYRLAGICVFAGLWLTVMYVELTLVPRTDLYRDENALYRAIADWTEEETPVVVYGMDPGQALFYCRRPIEVVKTPASLRSRLSAAPQTLVLTQAFFERDLRQLQTPVRVAETPLLPRDPDSQFVAYRMARMAAPSLPDPLGPSIRLKKKRRFS